MINYCSSPELPPEGTKAKQNVTCPACSHMFEVNEASEDGTNDDDEKPFVSKQKRKENQLSCHGKVRKMKTL